MRIIVCGGRDYHDESLIREALTQIVQVYGVTEIVTGGARGADMLADGIADEIGLDRIIVPANWKKHGRGAGHIRNRRMLTEFKPRAVLAFPGGRGTRHMIEIAKAAGLPVHQAERDEYRKQK